MPVVLERLLWAAYGMLFVLDTDNDMPEPPVVEGGVVGGLDGVIVAIRPYDEEEIRLTVVQGTPAASTLTGLAMAFDGSVMNFSGRGFVVGSPTSDEVSLGLPHQVGPVRVRVWHDPYPATHVVVAIGDG